MYYRAQMFNVQTRCLPLPTASRRHDTLRTYCSMYKSGYNPFCYSAVYCLFVSSTATGLTRMAVKLARKRVLFPSPGRSSMFNVQCSNCTCVKIEHTNSRYVIFPRFLNICMQNDTAFFGFLLARNTTPHYIGPESLSHLGRVRRSTPWFKQLVDDDFSAQLERQHQAEGRECRKYRSSARRRDSRRRQCEHTHGALQTLRPLCLYPIPYVCDMRRTVSTSCKLQCCAVSCLQ